MVIEICSFWMSGSKNEEQKVDDHAKKWKKTIYILLLIFEIVIVAAGR